MLKLENIIFNYDLGYFNFDFEIKEGDKLALIGASGVGKSSLLNLIAGFNRPSSGRILFNGEDITKTKPHLRPITIMFQEHNLFSHLKLEQNIAIGMSNDLKLNDLQLESLEKTIVKLGLSGLQNRYPSQLSGGQRQRVALARCILRNKPILLLDEPFIALDPSLRTDILYLVKELSIEYKWTVIMATHYLEDCRRLCNKTAFLFADTIYKIDFTESFFNNSVDEVIKDFLGFEIMKEKT